MLTFQQIDSLRQECVLIVLLKGRGTGIVRLSNCQEAVESPMSPDRCGVGCGKGAQEKHTVAEKKKVAGKRVAKKKVTQKKLAETGNKASQSVACVRNLGNSPRVPGARVGAYVGNPFLLGATKGGIARLISALCCSCPWPLFRRRGVHQKV